MFDYYFYGAGLRLGQCVVYASLWILIGLLIAAVFRYMLGAEKVRKLFGDGTRRGIFTGWLIGMLLPVCSLGVIPIVREMHRSGVKGGTIIAFALTAPLFNPMSVLYGLTLSDPIAIISFSLCALLIVSILGWGWDFIIAETQNDLEPEKMPTPGIKRIAAVFHGMAKELTGASGIYIGIGIACSVLVAISFPKGYLQSVVNYDNAMAPVAVAGIALPIYSTPLLAMSQIGGMFQHGNSIGAAFSLLILGAGANIGIVMWFIATFGWRRALAFLALLATTTIGLAYAVDKPLYPKGVDPKGHTHAFDVYTHPFGRNESGIKSLANRQLTEFWNKNEYGTTKVLGLLLVAGLILRVTGPQRMEPWFYSGTHGKGEGFDFYVPDWTLGAAAVKGLIVASVMGTYLYYPEPNELLEDMRAINTDVVLDAKTRKWDAAEKWIAYADDLSRRLEVGVFLRQGSVDEFKSAKAKIYREKLDILKEAVQERNPAGVDRIAMDVSKAYTRMSNAFREEEELAPQP